MNGWIKIYRKLLDNVIYKHDPNAWRVFFHLLLIVDHRTGSWDTGRFLLARELKMNPNTIYASLRRLENAKMITQVSNNKYTTISICNWNKYQESDNTYDNNKITTRQQQDNTKQELRIKNKEEYLHEHLKITKNEYEQLKVVFVLKDVKGECAKANDWLANSSRRYKDFPAFMRNWLRKCPNIKEAKKKDNFVSKYAKELANMKGME